MKLEKVRLVNFRGYADATISTNDLTALVGRNDAGKSTVLEALALFFETDGAKFEAGDVNKFGMATAAEISCTFSDLPEPLVLDETATTSLGDEFLLNADAQLEIVKRWRVGGKITSEIYARALHPSVEGIDDLLEQKIDQLRARLDARGLEVEDRRKAPLVRKALLAAVDDKALAVKDVPLSGDGDGKKIWQRLEKELPLYVLFKADRSTSDEDAEAQDPMKFAVRRALKEVDADLKAIAERVQRSVEEVANKTVAELRKIDEGIAADLSPTFKGDQKWDGLFKLSLASNRDIPLNKRGSGVRRLVLLSFLLSEIDRRKAEQSRENVIIAVEEPETALHPKQQELLIRTLMRLASEESVQVLLTTHAPALASLLPHRSLRLVRRAGPDDVAYVQAGDDTPSLIAEELGVLPHPDRRRVRVVICVEGPTDASFLRRAIEVLRPVDATLPDLSGDPRILVIPLGGGTLRHWVDNHYLKHLAVPEVHVYDRDVGDPPPYEAAADAVNARGDRSKAFLTLKRELENYYPHACIETVLGVPVPQAALTDHADVCMIAAEPTYDHRNAAQRKTWAAADMKLRRNAADRIKKELAEGILALLTAEGLAATGLAAEMQQWMEPVRAALADAADRGVGAE